MNPIKVSLMQGRDNGSKCVTWGIPWAEGEINSPEALVLRGENGVSANLQSKISARWPDGSVKWSLHSSNLNQFAENTFIVEQGESGNYAPMSSESSGLITVDTGKIAVQFNTSGNAIINSIKMNGRQICAAAYLDCILESRTEDTKKAHRFVGSIREAVVEEDGGIRSVVKISGIHRQLNGTREIFPFTLRFYFYKDSEEIRITHNFIYDGDANRDFLKGIGMRFEVPMSGKLYNRHVKIAGDNSFMHEALQLMTSWRPRIDAEIYKKQMRGEHLTLETNPQIETALKDITIWDNYKIYQDSSEHYVIKKRTHSDTCAYIDAIHGGRAKGLAYLGTAKNGFAVGMRNFWQKYPSTLQIENASTDTASITAWLWSPEAESADMRHYDIAAHAGAYYEGFDEIRSTPYGTANTNELYLCCFMDGIPSDETLSRCVETSQNPPVMLCTPEYMHQKRAFGTWGMINTSSEKGQWLEQQLDLAVEFYKNEVEQRKWYGFFNYGDFMHTYDNERHCWKYDMGGYAWQNTELVPTLWLWLAFLRSGRSDIYELAEAMTRHTSEVDVYHIGPFKGLGSRHNVVHWGCACKEARIAMAGHHRYYYYITGDERIGDIFDDVKDAEFGIERLDPLRHFYDDNLRTHARTGPDWSSLCANWMTAWERHGDTACRDKLLKGIKGIKGAPLQLISGSDFGFDPDSGEMIYIGESAAGGSHLVICMGAPSIWMELADSIKDPEFNKMLSDYGEFYLLSPEDKRKHSKGLLGGEGWSFPYMASAMVAYSAAMRNDSELAGKVWQILLDDWKGLPFAITDVNHFASASVKEEVAGISTNFVAQWCLNVIMCMDLIAKDTLI